jgi:hypothetical protein
MLFGHSPPKTSKVSLLEIVEHGLHLKDDGVYVQLLHFVGGYMHMCAERLCRVHQGKAALM